MAVVSLKRAGIATIVVASTLLPIGAVRAQFVPDETEVCPASARVYDPEFNAATQQMAYYDGSGGLRVAPVLADGSIGSPDCAGTRVARSVTISMPDLPFRAGPEWAQSTRGTELYFTKLDRDGRSYLARAWFDVSWRQQALPDTTDRGLALVSADATDPEPRLVYLRSPNPGVYELAWREASRPDTEAAVPGVVDPRIGGAPRWVPGRRALTLALPDAQGTKQAVMYEVDSQVLHYLTDDAGAKDEVWMWPAPEFGGALGLMTVADGCCLRFYRESDGRWQLYREIKASDFSSRPLMFSPELLVHNGRSFVVVQLAPQRSGYGEIWMLEVGMGGLPPVMLSDPKKRRVVRTEPEWLVTPGGAFVYITASDGASRFALNRLKTPLGPAGNGSP
jgi:hypothetical protein